MYAQHDNAAQVGDLLHWFLNDLLDQKSHHQIEFRKSPVDVNDALDEVATCWKRCQCEDLAKEGTRQHHTRAGHPNAVPNEDV